MRNISTPTETKINTRLGTEPQLILQINWSTGVEYYGFKTFSLGGWSVQGKMLDFSAISSQGKQDTTGEVSSANVKLDDSDGSLKTKVDRVLLESTSITVYHYFEGLSQSDLVVVLKGIISGDINWSEGERSLSFDIESYVEDRSVGYAPEAGAFANLAEEAIGVVWPLCFGTVLKVPAVRVKYRARGRLAYGINHNFDNFRVENGEDFPQGTPINLRIADIRFQGTFDEDIFTVIQRNLPHHTNIAIGNRRFFDTSYLDASVVWLIDQPNIIGLYCYVNHPTHGPMVNKCVGHEGQKYFFAKPWRPSGTLLNVRLTLNDTILETAPIPRSSWGATYTIENIATWYETLVSSEHEEVRSVTTIVQGMFAIRPGTIVNQEVSYNTTYVINAIPSIEKLEVFAYRTYRGKKIFAPVPKSYYILNLSNTLGTQNCTTLEFPISLEDYQGENWESTIYVSLRSTVGPNAASIISWLLNTYSSLTPDPVSFTSVNTKLQKYPCGFTVFDQPNVLDLCEEIAWQSRCALFIDNGIVYIKYLSEIPSSPGTIDETDTILKTMQLSFSSTEDIYTRVIAKWRKDYSEEEGVEREYRYSNNINTFGLRVLEKDFYIYNIESLVVLSASWWGYRYSNSWRRIAIDTILRTLEFQHFDPATFDFTVLSSNNIRGILDLINHDPQENVIHLEAELASNAGNIDGGNNPLENTNYWTGDPSYPVGASNPMPSDVGYGRAQIEYDVPTEDQNGPGDPPPPPPPPPPQYTLEFTQEPEEVERGVNFSLAIRIKDEDGNTVSENVAASLNLNSNDPADVLNTININIVGGTWSSDTMQITLGSGSDTASITVAAVDYASVTTGEFLIIEARVDSLSWASIPASVAREAVIADYTLSGGLVGEVIDIHLVTSDPKDKLYDSGDNELTSITLGAGGTYTFSGTYIKGGSGSDFGNFVAEDQLNKYDPKTSSQFTIAGITAQTVVTAIEFGQPVTAANADYLEITPPSEIVSGEVFYLLIETLNPNGTRDTSYNETLKIIAYNHGTGQVLTWLDAGSNASNNGGHVLANLENGAWAYDGCLLDMSSLPNNIRIEAEILYQEDQFNDSVIVATQYPGFYVTSNNYNITRGTPFNITIQAHDGNGALDTTYVPSGNVNITLPVKSDPLDNINPTYTDNTGWVNGSKSVAVTINGGSGSDTVTINCADAVGRQGEDDIAIAAASVVIGYSAKQYYQGIDSYTNAGMPDGSPGSATEWDNTQNDSLAAFKADTTLSVAGTLWVVYNVSDSNTYAQFFVSDAGGYLQFTVTPAQRAGAKAVYLEVPAYCCYIPNPGSQDWDDQFSYNTTLHIALSESPASYGSGLALWNMISDANINYAKINALHRSMGHTPPNISTMPRIPIKLPLSFFASMTTSTAYVWGVNKRLSNILYDSKYWGNTSYATYTAAYAQNTGGNNAQLVIYK